MTLPRSRFITALVAAFTLAACGGASVPGLPNPSSGVGALTEVFASRFGLSDEIADLAVGGLLGVANSNLPSGTWEALAGSIPGAEGLMSQALGTLPAGASIETLGDVGALLGDGADVSPSQLTDMGSLMGDFLGSAVDDDAIKDQISGLFR